MRNLRDRPPVKQRPFGVTIGPRPAGNWFDASFPAVGPLPGGREAGSMQSRGTEFAELFAAQNPR